MFFASSRLRFYKISLHEWHDSFLQEKRAQSTQFSVQSVKITFILFKFHRPIDYSNYFYLFILL